MDDIKDIAKAYLGDLIYHNLHKIKPMYKDVLDVAFPKNLSSIFNAIQKRHDIVHRNGKDKDGNVIKIAPRDVELVIKNMKTFIKNIDKQLPKRVGGSRT